MGHVDRLWLLDLGRWLPSMATRRAPRARRESNQHLTGPAGTTNGRACFSKHE
ncbi:hypothetical protein BIWAKO_02009 [Bosea sp. BIWAKO-01]|nr:hypothetical protein BIWAKO_02009 [Bosea sp. BIWAKO-01]